MPLDYRASPLEVLANPPIYIILNLSQTSEICSVFGAYRDEGPLCDITATGYYFVVRLRVI